MFKKMFESEFEYVITTTFIKYSKILNNRSL